MAPPSTTNLDNPLSRFIILLFFWTEEVYFLDERVHYKHSYKISYDIYYGDL